MLGAKRLFADRQCAFVERPRSSKVALGLEHAGEVVETFRCIGMLGAERLFYNRQYIAKKGGGLGISRALAKIAAYPPQKLGPACNHRSVIWARITLRQQMRCKLGAQRPRLQIVMDRLGIDRRQPCNQALDGILGRSARLGPCSSHRLHDAMHRHGRSAVLKGVVLHERNFGKRGEALHALRFILNRTFDQCHWDAVGRTLSEISDQCLRRLRLSHSFCDGEVEGRGDAPGIPHAMGRSINKAPNLPRVVGEPHLRALAVGRRMVEREREATEDLRKRLCPSISTSRAALKEGNGFLKRQHLKRDLISQLAPVREPRRDQHPRPIGWQKFYYVLWLGDVVVNQEPCRPLLRQSTQRSLRRLLNVSFVCRCCTQGDSKGRESTQQASARFGRTPTNARIQTSEAVRILNGE